MTRSVPIGKQSFYDRSFYCASFIDVLKD